MKEVRMAALADLVSGLLLSLLSISSLIPSVHGKGGATRGSAAGGAQGGTTGMSSHSFSPISQSLFAVLVAYPSNLITYPVTESTWTRSGFLC
jgi:hypothetical protein